jgi:hypothetical protein
MYVNSRGRFSLVGIATRFGLDVPVIESRWGEGEIFRTRSELPWGTPSLLYNGYPVPSPGVKRPGHGVDHPPHLALKLKKEKGYFSTPHLGLRGLL